jgi:2-oxoglutarate dehydrogenase E2 component (dihydrolipoamide succinyltransferase)
MGESIAEGTIVRWIKKVGEAVDRDEPLFEISTDKVDAEVPSPAAGILTEILVKEGETVVVDAVVATISQQGEVAATVPPRAVPQPTPSASESKGSTQPQGDGADKPTPRNGNGSSRPGPRATASSGGTEVPPLREATGASRPGPRSGPGETEDVRRQKSSPLVRKIAREHHVDIAQIHGSGVGGRVTKTDILGYLDSGAHDPTQVSSESAVAVRDSGTAGHEPAAPARGDIEPMSIMRKKIAEHMVLSRRTSAHVHTVFHVNFSTVDKIRQQKRGEYERLGVKLTYMAFIAKAVIDALRRHPVVNASLDGDNIVYKRDINLGIAVALPTGLIVPVVRNADERNLLGLSRAIADVADRARAKQLKPEEVHGGTFTITNPGQFGAQFGLPIINQPQVAILGVGSIEKRPVVVDDAIAIRTMAYLTLGFDHRLVDGAVADQFMADIKHQIEHFEPSLV